LLIGFGSTEEQIFKTTVQISTELFIIARPFI